VFRSGVASAPRTLGLVGIGWILLGIGKRLDGQISNLSGKPTNLLVDHFCSNLVQISSTPPSPLSDSSLSPYRVSACPHMMFAMRASQAIP
jgi:hypothetical protein